MMGTTDPLASRLRALALEILQEIEAGPVREELDNTYTRLPLVYATGRYPSRPEGVPAGGITYIGPVPPIDWLENDRWIDNR